MLIDMLIDMIKESRIDESGKNLEILISLPLEQTGSYTYDESEYYTAPNLVVVINNKHCDYTLSQMIYLDYKDSLQEGGPFINFFCQEEAEEFAHKYKLNIVYINGY